MPVPLPYLVFLFSYLYIVLMASSSICLPMYLSFFCVSTVAAAERQTSTYVLVCFCLYNSLCDRPACTWNRLACIWHCPACTWNHPACTWNPSRGTTL